MKTINVTPKSIRVPIVMPSKLVPSKNDLIKCLSIDDRIKFIYCGLLVADTIDGLILELENDTRKTGIYRNQFKNSINEIKRNIENFKAVMYRSNNLPERLRNDLVDKLDILDDNFRNDISILFLSVRRYVSKFINNPDHCTCMARASIIEILSQYSLMNDKIFSDILSKQSGMVLNLQDANIKRVNFFAKKFIGEFATLHGEMNIDLGDCKEIHSAFGIISQKANRIHEILKEKV